ncbi:phage tail assembly chaperone G [Bacillus cytotoxicus]|uniref:phage tail assembly chaperone G n=1 Tax=Bacillus cytotoxicus TaxID=580165 RepID=UPI001AEDA27C|nr:hypothetical protein [Bacillus cytotoxicus]QTR79146.1 hypothetical protein JC773_00725 [Bacillus cytotoxicus]
MDQLKLKLRQKDGKYRVYYLNNHISGLKAREAAELADSLKEDDVPFALVEQGAQFVSEVFQKQFTADEFLDGTHAPDLVIVIFAVAQTVLGKVAQAAQLLEAAYAQHDKKKNHYQKNRRKNRQHIQK